MLATCILVLYWIKPYPDKWARLEADDDTGFRLGIRLYRTKDLDECVSCTQRQSRRETDDQTSSSTLLVPQRRN